MNNSTTEDDNRKKKRFSYRDFFVVATKDISICAATVCIMQQ
jgi:hypothetical protein